jgi:hypothetical protein
MTKLDLRKLAILASLVGCGGHDVEPQPDAAPDAIDVDAVTIGVDAPTEQCSDTADECPGESICIAGRCEAAFGRIYDIRSIVVTLPTLDPNGEYWDFGGGAPDINVSILTNGVLRVMTGTVSDTFSAVFPGPYPVLPVGGGSLRLDVYDEDVTTFDFAYGCLASPLTAEMLRKRRLSCVSGGNSLNLTIEPR